MGDRGGADAVTVHTETLQGLLQGGHRAEDADGAGEGHRRGDDQVGVRAQPVAARGGHGPHGHDHRFACLFHERQFLADQFTGERAAAAGADAQDKGFDPLVLARLADLPDQVVRADLADRAGAVEDVALGDDDADQPVLALCPGVRRGEGFLVVGETDVGKVVCCVRFAEQRLEFTLHFLMGLQAVHQAGGQRQGAAVAVHRGQVGHLRIDVFPQVLQCQLAVAGDVGGAGGPQVAQPEAVGLPVLGRHVVADERFQGRLVGADAEHVQVHRQPVEQFPQVEAEHRKAAQVDRAHGLQVDPVRPTGQVVLGLGVGVGKGDHLLARLPEPFQGRTDALHLVGAEAADAARLEQEQLDAAVIGGVVDGVEQVLQGHVLAQRPAGEPVDHPGQGVDGRAFLDDAALRGEHQGRTVGHGDRRLVEEQGEHGNERGKKQQVDEHRQAGTEDLPPPDKGQGQDLKKALHGPASSGRG